ncbi:putative small auxin-up RNA [Rosa chinensis]|uniref:Putative small auxin-up RNA n=1 Tax=Rosa chinensis TaxID=74649 RepID=A0A2P6RC34_ROSCH|nr:auxin-induced protein 6B [Rosa chinensis]PRQ43993.1 putative small auxin-up RNA [Rosa chinensis]
MLGKKMVSFKNLAKKVKAVGATGREPSHYECLLRDSEQGGSPPTKPPTGFLAVYVGEERQRFVVPTSFLSHPLFKMLLEKAYNEFGFQQRNGLVVPCSVSAFEEVVSAMECSHGQFDFGELVEEFIS